MSIHGEKCVIRGGVLFVLADTLAAHAIGGFKVGVGFSLRKCRMCLATQDQMSTKVVVHVFMRYTFTAVHIYFGLVQSKRI